MAKNIQMQVLTDVGYEELNPTTNLNAVTGIDQLYVWEKRKFSLQWESALTDDNISCYVDRNTSKSRYMYCGFNSSTGVYELSSLVTKSSSSLGGLYFTDTFAGSTISNPQTVYQYKADPDSRSSSYHYKAIERQAVLKKTDNLIGYVFSTDKNAYSSVSDEYVYIFKEVLGNFPLLAYGSYIGTGSYGPSAPVSLATGFFPKMLYVKSSNGSLNLFLPFTRMRTRYYESYEKVLSDNLTFGSNGNNLLICSTVSAAAQCDTANERYDWIAIG